MINYKLKKIRQSSNITILELSNLLNYPISKISKIENNKQQVSIDYLINFCKVLNIKISDILEEDNFDNTIDSLDKIYSIQKKTIIDLNEKLLNSQKKILEKDNYIKHLMKKNSEQEKKLLSIKKLLD